MEKKEAVIQATGLKKSFQCGDTEQVIFENLDLEIYKGDFTVIMGSSGAGKSTLLYALSGMDRPVKGEVKFCKEVLTKLTDDQLAVFRRKNCGFVFQQNYLLDKMSLMDNVIVAGVLVSSKRNEIVAKAKKLFELVHISSDTQKKFPNQISGGEAQRAGIVRAVINSPNVVFADEPTGALNSDNSKAVLDILSKLYKEGQSIIMVTHDKKSALRANRVIYLKDGQIFGDCNLGTYEEENTKRAAKLDKFLLEMGW